MFSLIGIAFTGFALVGVGTIVMEVVHEATARFPGICQRKWCRRNSDNTSTWTATVGTITRSIRVEGCNKHFLDLEAESMTKLDSWAQDAWARWTEEHTVKPNYQRVL